MKPWFSMHLPRYTFADTSSETIFDRIVEQAQTAEECGFAQVSVMDHLYQIPNIGTVVQPMLEGYSVLSALARETKRVRLGTMVTGVTYRNPALLAKQVTTLDVISGGRAMLGIGAAWFEAEHAGFGYDFPPVRERMDRLEDALEIATGMFRNERFTYAGRYHSVSDIINSPRPVQPGGPRILVGGGGEQRTLRIAARFADMTHWFADDLEGMKRKGEILDGYCAQIGRDPAQIERTTGTPAIPIAAGADADEYRSRVAADRRAHVYVGSAEDCADVLRPYVDAGYTGFTFNNSIFRTPDEIRVVAETLHLIGG